MVEGACLESTCTVYPVPQVRILSSPPLFACRALLLSATRSGEVPFAAWGVRLRELVSSRPVTRDRPFRRAVPRRYSPPKWHRGRTSTASGRSVARRESSEQPGGARRRARARGHDRLHPDGRAESPRCPLSDAHHAEHRRLRDLATNAAGRIFTILFMAVGVGVFVVTLSTFAAFLVEGRLRDAIGRHRMERDIQALRDHIIVCGFGRFGQKTGVELAGSRRRLRARGAGSH